MNLLEKIELDIHKAFPNNADKVSELMKSISGNVNFFTNPLPDDRPIDLPSVSREENIFYHGKTGKVFVTVSFKDKKPFEIFSTISKSDSPVDDKETTADSEAVCRMISLWLRSGGSVDEVTKQLRGISNGSAVFRNNGKNEVNTSLYDAIAHVLHEVKDLELEFMS